jgi:UDP-N-acetyl-2-amino-2-deoxyglucuronate dehydrogenase
MNTDVDIVTLCTPSGLHAQQTLQLAASGKHIITEKPMALHVSDGIKMIEACDAANVKLFVVKQNRYHPTLQLLKHAITKNRFGKIYLINLNVFWTRPQSYYDQANWRGTLEMDGGAFMNQASHYVDLLDWLFGPIQSVHAMMGTLARDIAVEDTGILNLRWHSGTLGSMNVTMLTYPKNYEASLTVLGERGTVKIGGMAVNEIQTWEFSERLPEDDKIDEVNYATKTNLSSHVPYYKNVIEVLRGNAEPMVDGREGLKSLKILTSAYESAKSNEVIKCL